MEQAVKKKNWQQPRHQIIRNLLEPIIGTYCRLRYGVKVEKFTGDQDRAYLVLFNHQTAFDQFFVYMAFRKTLYFVSTEDIFSMGWISNVIRWLAAPIPIKKQTTDINAVMTCMRIAREGSSIAMAPEGNRTYCGRTVHMNPAVAPLVRKLKLPVALYRLEGGYGVQPRWSDVIRWGKMRGYVSQVIEPEEYAAMTNEELYEKIRQGLAVDEACLDGNYFHTRKAEYLERAIYVCPECGLSEIETRGNKITCKKCGLQAEYLSSKELKGIGREFPFRFVGQWYDYQENFINDLDLFQYVHEPVYTDLAEMREVIIYKKKNLIRRKARLCLYGDRIIVDEGTEQPICFPFEEVSAVTVLGRNKLNIYHGGNVWQIKGGKRFNALKYVNFFYRHKNLAKGDVNGKFLGL